MLACRRSFYRPVLSKDEAYALSLLHRFLTRNQHHVLAGRLLQLVDRAVLHGGDAITLLFNLVNPDPEDV